MNDPTGRAADSTCQKSYRPTAIRSSTTCQETTDRLPEVQRPPSKGIFRQPVRRLPTAVERRPIRRLPPAVYRPPVRRLPTICQTSGHLSGALPTICQTVNDYLKGIFRQPVRRLSADCHAFQQPPARRLPTTCQATTDRSAISLTITS